MKSFLVFFLTVLLVMTLNCSILYHCSRLSVHGNGGKTYTVKELEILRNYVVNQCNEYCFQVERDKNANAIYSGNLDDAVKSNGFVIFRISKIVRILSKSETVVGVVFYVSGRDDWRVFSFFYGSEL